MTTVSEATILGNGIGDASMLEIGNMAAAPDVTADDAMAANGPIAEPGELAGTTVGLEGAIRIDQGKVEQHLSEVVRATVEETLNGLLDAEADRLCGAKRYAREAERFLVLIY